MTTEFTGGSDPDRMLPLLWRHSLDEPAATRGPVQRVSVDRIVSAAIAVADGDGLDALSMRRVAQEVGVGAMSLYTYVPGKAELIDLMIDQVIGEIPRSSAADGTIRQRLETVAREDWDHYARHPWTLQVDTSRPPLGPGISDRYEYEVALLESLGMTDLEIDSVVTLVTGFVAGAARVAIDTGRGRRASGQTDEEWWNANAPVLERVIDGSRYPVSGRVGQTVGEYFQSSGNPAHAFEFGLQRMLDGIEAFVDRKR